MKRIVINVQPYEAATESPATADATARTQPKEPDSPSGANGSFRLEVVVSDREADVIIATATRSTDENAADTTVQQILRQELGRLDPESNDLYTRIVTAVERELISQIYSECHQVKTRTAARLGIDRNTLHKKLQRFRLADA